MTSNEPQQQLISEAKGINPTVEVLEECSIDSKSQKITCRCRICGHEWQATSSSLLKGSRCSRCKQSGTSFMEQFVYQAFVAVLGNDKVISRDRSVIDMELDIFVSPNLAIELGGWYWHKDKVYGRDAEKRKRCKNKGIRLITIYDSVPADADVPDDCIAYPFDLASEENHTTLKELTAELLSLCPNGWMDNLPDWRTIEQTAAFSAGIRNHAQFVSEMKEINPTIKIKSEYVNDRTKVSCQCDVCGCKWETWTGSLLKGHGCPKCGAMSSILTRRKTHEQFIAELVETNPKVEVEGRYINAITKIQCLCKKCGCRWMVVPDSLLQGTGCPCCGQKSSHDTQRKTHEQFVAELATINPAVEAIGTYAGAFAKIQCECKTCGNMWFARPDNLLHGTGCPKCGRKKAENSRRKTHEQFIDALRAVNSSIEVKDRYRGSKEKVSCRCRVCGHEWQARAGNLLSGKGCPGCKTRDFIERTAKRRAAKKRNNTSSLETSTTIPDGSKAASDWRKKRGAAQQG